MEPRILIRNLFGAAAIAAPLPSGSLTVHRGVVAPPVFEYEELPELLKARTRY